jgi:hypothetical protein
MARSELLENARDGFFLRPPRRPVPQVPTEAGAEELIGAGR